MDDALLTVLWYLRFLPTMRSESAIAASLSCRRSTAWQPNLDTGLCEMQNSRVYVLHGTHRSTLQSLNTRELVTYRPGFWPKSRT